MVTVHHLPREVVRVAHLQAHLMPRLFPKMDNACTKMATSNPSILEICPLEPINAETAPLSGSKWPPRAVHSLELPNLAARGAHFEPTVEMLPN